MHIENIFAYFLFKNHQRKVTITQKRTKFFFHETFFEINFFFTCLKNFFFIKSLTKMVAWCFLFWKKITLALTFNLIKNEKKNKN